MHVYCIQSNWLLLLLLWNSINSAYKRILVNALSTSVSPCCYELVAMVILLVYFSLYIIVIHLLNQSPFVSTIVLPLDLFTLSSYYMRHVFNGMSDGFVLAI